MNSVLASSHIKKSTDLIHGNVCLSGLPINFTRIVSTFCKNVCLIASTLPSPKSHMYQPSPLPLWSGLSKLSEMLPSRLQSSFCPQIKFNLNSHIVQFFHSTYINYKKKKKNSGSSWSDQGGLQRGCLKMRKERFCFLPVLDTKLYSKYAWSKSGDQNLVKTCVKLLVQGATLCYERAIKALWSGFSHRAQIIQVWNCEGSGKATQQK